MTASTSWRAGPRKTSAGVAREQGWRVGTRLIGRDGVDEQRVTITAIGTMLVLVLVDDGHGERPLDLTYRKWSVVGTVVLA